MCARRLWHEDQAERFIDMRRDRLAGHHAALVETRGNPPVSLDDLVLAGQGRVSLKAVKAVESEPFGNRCPLRIVSVELDPLAIVNLVELQSMGKAIAHSILPCAIASAGVASSLRRSSSSAPAI